MKNRKWKSLLAVVPTVALLSACGGPAVTTAPTSTANVSVGTAPVNSTDGAIMFAMICADPFPNFNQSRSQLSGMPFKRNDTTGTYYHQNVDMSVKLFEEKGNETCSMVFGSKDDPQLVALSFGAVAEGSKGQFGIRATGVKATGQPLYQAWISR